jgi:hypothetical protein
MTVTDEVSTENGTAAGRWHPPVDRDTVVNPVLGMPVRLNITIDEDVHERLKQELPAKGISRFINDAVRARLRPSREVLDEAYQNAARESWRTSEKSDWETTDTEGWLA